MILWIIFMTGWLINFIWENAHAPLYTVYTNFIQHLPLAVWTSTWDAGFVTLLYLLIALFYRDFFWFRQFSLLKILIIFSVGFGTATIVELDALEKGKWAYEAIMPLVSGFAVGLTPFVQLAVTSLLTYKIAQKIVSKIG